MGTKTGLDRLVINELALRFLAAFIVKRIGSVLCVDQVLNRNVEVHFANSAVRLSAVAFLANSAFATTVTRAFKRLRES
jgi:hypothetical protein